MNVSTIYWCEQCEAFAAKDHEHAVEEVGWSESTGTPVGNGRR